MKYTLTVLGVLLLTMSCGALAQAPDSSSQATSPPPQPRAVAQPSAEALPAFSRMSFGAGLSPLGIGLQVSTNLNDHFNLRGIGNIFKYSTSFTTSGIPVDANLNLSSAGALVDVYPFHVGFRLSGGLLFLNQNEATATASVPGGDSITLDHQTYYSANTNSATGAAPLTGTGNLALNETKPGFMLTTGWGNHVKRSGHWTFPFELGVAFVGSPKVTMALSGWACTDAAQTQCTNIADPANPIAAQFQSNLNSQIAKWNSNLSALSSYPILSFGVAYSFQTRQY